jgi:hypothetical protein
VLAIHRHEIATAPAQRRQNERPADDERLLVREREPLAGLERAERGLQPGRAHDGVDHDLRIGVRRGLSQRGRALPPTRGRRDRTVHEHHQVGIVPLDLRRELGSISMRRECHHAKTVTVPFQHRERTAADRARRAQERDPRPHPPPPQPLNTT